MAAPPAPYNLFGPHWLGGENRHRRLAIVAEPVF